MAKTAEAKPVERGITFWMGRVVAECDNARGNFDVDAVHDLRVAFRRCRSMAEGFQGIDRDPCWKKMRRKWTDLMFSGGCNGRKSWTGSFGD